MQEGESPRGRLSLISAYFKGELHLDAVLRQHLDHCLLCRSCENICPAQVPFALIMDTARANIGTHAGSDSWLKKRLLNFVSHRQRARKMVAVASRMRLTSLTGLLPLGRFPVIGRYARAMQAAPTWQDYYPAKGEQKFSVGLFLGCVAEFFDSKSLQDTIQVLNHLGVGVYVPKEQQCCGAMHLHNGNKQVADSLLQQNSRAFDHYEIDYVVSLSSACTVTLIEQSGFAAKVTDICSLLEDIEWHKGRQLNAIHSNVLMHYPCTQKNVLKNTGSTAALISRIPGLSVSDFSSSSHCCGAAGSYVLDQPEWSETLKKSTAQAIKIQHGIIVSSNIGCILQFRHICDDNDDLQVLFPITLVARSLGISLAV